MTTCAKCGAENVAGDAFCGNCGAFLEFAAEEAAEAVTDGSSAVAPPPATSADAMVGSPPVNDAPAQPVPPAAPSASPPAGATPSGSAPAPAPAATGPTCTACGRANPTGRRFCISCGERLPSGAAAAATPAGPAHDAEMASPGPTSSVAAAPTAPGGPARPAWDFPTAPVPAAQPVPTTATATSEAGGRSRLPLVGGIVLVLALAGGGALFLLNGGLGGGTPAATASPGPSVAVASDAPSPDSTASPAPSPEATPEPTAAPTVPPGPSVGIKITGAKASSQLSAKRSVKNLHDGSPATTWKSASDKFEGSWIEVSFAPTAVTRIQVWSGWQVDESFFYGNHRPRNVTVAFDGGDPVPLLLKDVLGAQRVDIPPELGIIRASRVRITIVDVYPARKTTASGSPTDQVAVCEIKIFGIPATP